MKNGNQYQAERTHQAAGIPDDPVNDSHVFVIAQVQPFIDFAENYVLFLSTVGLQYERTHDGTKRQGQNHDFAKTPEKDEIVRRLRKMQSLDADIPKIALMPTCKRDVLTLLEATLEMSEQYADRPIITMSMAGTRGCKPSYR